MSVTLSRQQQKSKETKDRIFRAAKEIMQKHGYEELSIKNICEKAGVSNGSFYHHFKTKDDLLSYYIENQPAMDTSLLALPESVQDVKETIIQVYLNYVRYCEELGVDFMSSYYTPKNQALNPAIRTERTYPIVTVEHYLKRAISCGVLSDSLNLEEITTDIRMLIIGNVFEWCLCHGETDFAGNIRRSFGRYLDSILPETR
jgi:AcrR family transcriptional regulator